MDEENESSGISLLTFVEERPAFFLAIGAVVVFLLVVRFRAQKTTAPTSQQDLSGLDTNAQGQKVVYVPTSTEFYTDNSINATSADNAPASIGPINSPTSTQTSTQTSTSTSTTTVNPPPVVVPPPAPPPVRNPPVTPPPASHGTLKWDQGYTVGSGDNLSRIASAVTAKIRGQGAPSGVIVGWSDIYAHNKTVIDNTARARGNPIPGGPQNNIFTGEHLTVPRWVK